MTETKDLREVVATQGSTLNSLFDRAIDIQDLCEDYTVSGVTAKSMLFNSTDCRLLYIPDGSSTFRKKEMTSHSLSQLCTKLGVPSRYIDKCIDSGRLDLAADNMNSWIEDCGKSFLIREYKNTIRGVLSDRFSVLDTPNVIEVLADVFGNSIEDYSIKGHLLTPERFHLRLVQKEMLDIEGEDLFAGVQIDSSDVGRSVLEVKFLIYKQVCTNGLTISKGSGTLFRQKHLGIDSAMFRDNFRESLRYLPEVVRESVALVEGARKDSDKYKTSHLNEKQIEAFIKDIKFKTRLSDNGVEKVIALMNDTYGTSTWGFVNSLTDVAQDYTLERRLEIESFAGSLLSA